MTTWSVRSPIVQPASPERPERPALTPATADTDPGLAAPILTGDALRDWV